MNFEPGTSIRSIDNPGREGVVTNAAARQKPSGTFVQVRWSDGALDWVHVDEIEGQENIDDQDPYALIRLGRYGRAGDLRRNLTYVHLSGRLANLVYSMGITSTDFYPHQYRPLLALLDSPANGLLIADEVGLGKTIEAGLIWTEMRARFDMRRLLVICPAMLREKWRDELRIRFGVEARLVDAETLIDELQQPRHQIGEGRAWIASYNAARPPRDWRPQSRSAPKKPGARWRLADLLEENGEQEPILDMVVFDEAHYMRNRESAAWRLGDLLRDVAEYRVMLSATPINLHNQDLFSLLNLIDPDHFSSEQDFQRILNRNKPLVAARDVALNRESTALAIVEKLQIAASDSLLGEFRQLRALLDDPPTDERLKDRRYRASLAETIERLNLLSHVVTRTRKKDVQGRRVIREVHRESVKMSDAERQFYELVTDTTRRFAIRNEIVEGFLLAMPQRQVTSCPAAIAAAWGAKGRDLDELIEDSGFDLEEDDESDQLDTTLRQMLEAIVPRKIDAATLRAHDSKFTRLKSVLSEYLGGSPTEKVVLFTSFRTTARYLADRLAEDSIPSILLWGNQVETKQEVIDDFRSSPTARVLVSTEVAAEGVDLQFCKVLINYDMPWNPTRVEQRIGRIDRLGQKAERIHIWNLFFEATIDEKVIGRLFRRLKIFTESLGEAEAVVGDVIRKLESSLLVRELTEEEENRQIDQAAMALENVRLHREELERNSAHMMAHGQHVIDRIEAAQELARRVTEQDLYVFVRDYLNRYASGHRFSQSGNDAHLVNILLPSDLASRLDDFLRSEGLHGKTLLATGLPKDCRFLNRISEPARKGEEIIHQFHPLIRFIAADLRARNEHFYSLVAVGVSPDEARIDLRPGTYVFACRSWIFRGVRDEEHLAVCAVNLLDGTPLGPEQAESLLLAGRMHGTDVSGAAAVFDAEAVQVGLESAEAELDQRYRAMLQQKRNENADRAAFQLSSVDAYLERRLPKLRDTLLLHISMNRSSLAKATQGQIDKLTARMNVRKDRIREREKIAADRNPVCAGVIVVRDLSGGASGGHGS